jgi:hypothetical protein
MLKNVLIQVFVENLVKPFQELIKNLLKVGIDSIFDEFDAPPVFPFDPGIKKEQVDHGKEIKEELLQAQPHQHRNNLVQEHLEIFS